MTPFDPKKHLRKNIQNLQPYQSAREEFKDNRGKMILLDANENPFETTVNRYPDPMQMELKQRLAVFKEVAPENIFLSNGSDEIISQLILAFCEPKEDHILIVPPTFGMYAASANIYSVGVKTIPLSNNFQLNVPAILDQTNVHSKILFVPTPNNPTGNHFPDADLRLLAESFPGILMLDEAYVEYSPQKSTLSWIEKYPNLVVCQTFSKAQGLAGARFGMAFANREIIAAMNKIKAPYNLNILTQRAVMNRLGNQGMVDKQVKEILTQKKRLIGEFKNIRFIKKVFPSDANFLLVRVDNSNQRYQDLIAEGIVVRNPSKQFGCENTLRITVGTEDQNTALLKALNRIQNDL